MSKTLLLMSLLIAPSVVAVSQEKRQTADCHTLKYSRHKVSCLCGKASVCAGDLCGGPSVYGLDDEIDVLLRDKHANPLQSQKLSYKADRKFCFEGRLDGEYQMAFVLHEGGIAQPAVVFPTSLKKARNKPCDSIYMVEPYCPT
jgi:hypothetical protein